MKIVGLAHGKNEEPRLAFFLKCLALYVDTVVFMDNGSTDRTLQILNDLKDECRIEAVFQGSDRNELLSQGRALGGTHFVVLSCDEVLTSNLHVDSFRDRMVGMRQGDSLWLPLIKCWKSPFAWRPDIRAHVPVVFCDDRNGNMDEEEGIPVMGGFRWKSDGVKYGLVSFRCVNWQNVLLRQAWSKCRDRVQFPDMMPQRINERNLLPEDGPTQRINDEWYAHYPFDPPDFLTTDLWRLKQIHQWIGMIGMGRFEELHLQHVL